VEPLQLCQKVLHGIRLIKKSRFAVGHEFWNARDVGRENNPLHGHGFHQRHRDTFTAAGQYHNVSLGIELGKEISHNVAAESDLLPKVQLGDQLFEFSALFPVAGDVAAERNALLLERGACEKQKAVVLRRVETSHAEDGEGMWATVGLRRPDVHINAERLHEHLERTYLRIVSGDVFPVEIGNGDAEAAIGKFCVEIIGANQQIGAVQGHAKAGVRKPRSHHSHPGREISVMNVDVPDPFFFQQNRKIGGEPGVDQSAAAG